MSTQDSKNAPVPCKAHDISPGDILASHQDAVVGWVQEDFFQKSVVVILDHGKGIARTNIPLMWDETVHVIR